MRAWAAASALVFLLSGCTGPPPPPTAPAYHATLVDRPTGEATEDGAYAFRHAGGAVEFALPLGTLNVTLFGPDDERLGAFSIGPGHAARLAAPAGELVVVTTRMGTGKAWAGLAIDSAGAPVVLVRTLPLVRGAVALAADQTLVGLGGLGPGRTVPINATIEGPPLEFAAAAAGAYEDLAVEVVGEGGALVSAGAAGSGLPGPVPAVGGYSFAPLPGQSFPQNASGHALEGSVSYAALDGVVVLEYTTYSRAGRIQEPRPGEAGPPPFSYGRLPHLPVLLHVAPDAHEFVLGAPAGAARVMLYDPDDRMIGVFGVPAGGRLGIPIRGGGAYVAVAENGTAEIGADRTPADPDLHPLATVTGDYPSRPPGRDGGYGEADEEVGQPGVPFGFEAVVLHDPFAPFSLCYDEAPSRLLQGNRTIGYGGGVGDGWDGWASASVYLDGTALTVHGGGFGDDGCARPGVRVTSYVRP